jgi:hypothetical protein
MRLTFSSDHLLELLRLSEAAHERIAAPDQIFDPDCWWDDMDPDLRAEAKAMLSEEEEDLPPIDRSHVDPRKVPAGLWLVGDHGVFLAPNVEVPALEVEGRLAAYAREADPTLLAEKEWRAFKEATFGPEDGVDFISAASLREAHIPEGDVGSLLEPGGTFVVEVSAVELTILGTFRNYNRPA